jgi:3-oxoacyl-[acyl-carrier protein] reductase
VNEKIQKSLENRVAVITGSSRGIGRAIAIEMANLGASVVVNYKTSAKNAKEVIDIIRSNSGNAIAVEGDVSIYSQAQNLVNKAIDNFGTVDILVNNAGITRDNLIMRMSEEEWDCVQTTNLKSTFNCSKIALRYMIRKRYGRIINITSISGQMGNPGQSNYSASKAGQIGFTKALAREVASRNITVNAIAAGYIDTDLWAQVPGDIQNSMLSLIPLGRKGQPEEIAFLVAFLASDQAAYITGQAIGIDGGLAMM